MSIDSQLLALLCGHFLGDFVFQTDRLVALKAQRTRWMAFHVLMVASLTWLLLGNLAAWWIVGILFVIHGLVDYGKISADAAYARRHPIRNADAGPVDGSRHDAATPGAGSFRLSWLIGDQIVHLVTLVALWYALVTFEVADFQVNYWHLRFGAAYAKGLLLLTGLALGVFGVSVVLKIQMAEFAAALNALTRQGMPKGGKTIGILERLLVFMFVLAGKPEGVGFVIAAKSVFRIGDLTNKEDRDQAEYIMIGTLRSFTYALAIAFITKWLMDGV